MNFLLRVAPLTGLLMVAAPSALALPNSTDTIPTKTGPIKITPIYHASMQIEYQGKVIQIDPFSQGDYTGAKKADYIFITHTHPDHLDPGAISRLVQPQGTTTIVGPASVIEKFQHYRASPKAKFVKLGNGEAVGKSDTDSLTTYKSLIAYEAVPAYNIVRGPKPGEKYHPRGEFNGYILKMGGKRIYISGDTEATPAMKALKNIDVAFVSMNLPYTMTPQEAAKGVKAFKPKIVYPYHYRYPFDKPNENPQQFQKALAGSGIQVRLRGWYAHPAG